jgi:hypothetical protein
MAQVAGLDLKAFIRALAADAPSPGAGAAGAAALGMAAACAAKALAISARHAQAAALADAADKAREIALLALAAADWDAEDYPAWLHARADREGAEAILRQDGETTLALAGALTALLDTHAPAVIPSLAGDLAAARALITAFTAIEARNLGELSEKDQ